MGIMNDTMKQHTWVKGQSGNPHGRPKDRALSYIRNVLAPKGNHYSKKYNGINENEAYTWDVFFLTATQEQIIATAKDSEVPLYAKNHAMALIQDVKSGRTTTMDKIRERVFGKVSETIKLEGINLSKDYSNVSDDELKEGLKRVVEALKDEQD